MCNKTERSFGGKALALGDAAGEVRVNLYIGIDIVKHQTLGVLYIKGALPCHTPAGDIFLCETFGLLEEVNDHLTLLCRGLFEVHSLLPCEA